MSLRGKSACTVSFFYEKAPLSSVPLFKEKGAAVCFQRFGTHRCRGTELPRPQTSPALPGHNPASSLSLPTRASGGKRDKSKWR